LVLSAGARPSSLWISPPRTPCSSFLSVALAPTPTKNSPGERTTGSLSLLLLQFTSPDTMK